MTTAEAKQQLTDVLGQLETVRQSLLEIRNSLPKPPAEQDPAADMSDEMDAETELRVTIECVLDDNIRPALQDLRDVLATLAKVEKP